MTTNQHQLPSAEVCARIAIAIAGVGGNRHIGHAITARGSALDLVADIYDERPLPELLLAHRIRTLASPAVVGRVLSVTSRLGLHVLVPGDDCWPRQLDALGAAAPVCLWVGGDPTILLEAPIAITGTTSPGPWLQHTVLDLTTRVADAGWTVATTTRAGVDRLAHHAALAMHGDLITVATTARRNGHRLEVVVSENPPLLPVLASALRTPALLAAIAGKVLAAGGEDGSGAVRAGVAAHALDRPIGVVDDGEGRAGTHPLHRRFDAPVVASLVEVERLR